MGGGTTDGSASPEPSGKGSRKALVFDFNRDTMPMMVEIQKLEDARKATQRHLEDVALKYGVTFQ